MVTVIEMPKLSPTMEQGKVVNWAKEEGDALEKGEILFEVETDKANVEIESPRGGYLRKILVKANVLVGVNTPIAIIADSMKEDVEGALAARQRGAEVVSEEKETPLPAQAKPFSAPSAGRVKISPIAQKLAKEHGIDPTLLQGTGPGGRIVKEDVEQAFAQQSKIPTPIAPPHVAPSVFSPAPYKDIELTKMRRVIAQRLSESKRVAPHFYVDMTADVTNIIRLKEDLEKKVEQAISLKLTLTDILLKLVSQVLKEFPMLNASLLEDRIRMFQEINIGVAVGIEEGLVVPVVRNVDQKTVSHICQEVKDLVNKARNKRLLPHEYSGGTFTVTNLGMFGVENFHAIINQPESAILAVSSIKQSPVVVDGKIESRPLMNLSLSVDHRVVDGVMAARFLGRIKELIESPYLLFV
ncbi:MAG: 2-oxo acid dehydrogenase subunit E2 [Deltaproteobacteria bacterium]|nr:2-oxo acid dehydrogenase subunit E2 [Deltaproteobacteria bacterium]